MTEKLTIDDLYPEDGSFSPALEQAHIESYKRLINDGKCSSNSVTNKRTESSKHVLYMQPGSEIELHKDGSLKRYKF